MKQQIVKFLHIVFPFFITLFLWRLSTPYINPAGVLAIIPIFYYSFIRPTPYFTAYALLFCFLIDYKFNTILVWTIFYSIYYVIMNIQTVIDLTHTNKNGLYAFLLFIGPVLLFIMLTHLGWTSILLSLMMFFILGIFYIPITHIAKAVNHD